ncbi:MAG: peptidylprolyl isomerase [Treponema sp.]|nr:peptidylprolyl isomerase [Treponema sp.]MBQ4235984.1 peptidylprolyl isomerase [Treponema sp.]MBQ5384663.1 peptidylprolyl isomerase [Treponema sp.]
MQITKNALVTINYTLKGDDGNLIDTSVGAEPLIYLHGQNFLLPKLEEYLEGKSAGEKITAVLPPEDGYGIYDERMVAKIPRENFETAEEILVGTKFQADTPEGPAIVTVTEVGDDVITVDANHELAGKTLHFDVEVLDVREASQEEIQQMTTGCGCGGCGGGCGEGCGSNCGEGCNCSCN